MRPIDNTRPLSLTDRVYSELVSGVVSGELAPGDRLTDRRLAEELGVSRTPIREALQRMVQGGLAEARGRAGWTVSQLGPRDIEELFQLRSLLEPAGIRRIIDEDDQAAKRELLGYFDRFGDSVAEERYEEYFGVDRSFHSQIVGLSATPGSWPPTTTWSSRSTWADIACCWSRPERVDQDPGRAQGDRRPPWRQATADRALQRPMDRLSHGQELLLATVSPATPGPRHAGLPGRPRGGFPHTIDADDQTPGSGGAARGWNAGLTESLSAYFWHVAYHGRVRPVAEAGV